MACCSQRQGALQLLLRPVQAGCAALLAAAAHLLLADIRSALLAAAEPAAAFGAPCAQLPALA